jgi:hypothetical protein
VSTLEVLLGVPNEQDFMKFFWKGSEGLIARRGGNKVSHFLEAATFEMGGRKGSFLSLRAVEGGDGTNSLAS